MQNTHIFVSVEVENSDVEALQTIDCSCYKNINLKKLRIKRTQGRKKYEAAAKEEPAQFE